jgi:hypothetical protein
MLRRAQARIIVPGIKPRVHADFIVVGRDQAGECVSSLVLNVRREAVVTPGFADKLLRAGGVPLGQHSAGQRKFAFGGARRFGAEERNHSRRIGVILPDHRFGFTAQRNDARPAWVGRDEGGIAGKIGVRFVGAQDCPFDELARNRIGDRAFGAGRVVGAAVMRLIHRLFDGSDIEWRGGRTRCHGKRRCGLP